MTTPFLTVTWTNVVLATYYAPPTDSIDHFLKGRFWRFGRGWRGVSFRYRMEHPVWRTYPVEAVISSLDPSAILGGHWPALDWAAALHSVVLAEGSAARIYPREPLVGSKPDTGGIPRTEERVPATAQDRALSEVAL